jgi:hypothetical protein
LGTEVIVMPPAQGHYGIILCVDPGYVTDGRNLRSDFIVQGGRTGLYVEDAHDAPLTKLQYQGGNPCFNGGRPFDSTSAGEVNYFTETGLAFHLDSFLSYLRVDEETGLFLFYMDQMLRLAGHNLQFRSALGEREELDDQQEAVMFSGQTPYTWERLGAWTWCQPNYREIPSAQVQTTSPEYSLLEPAYDDQQPFYRAMEFGGYLGQAWKRMVALPPASLPSSVNRYSQQHNYVGVFNEQVGLEGSYLMQARRIGLFKTSAIPVPKMMKRPEDENGDNETNYKAAGTFGPADGEDHILAGQFTNPNAVARELVNAASVLDMGAFLTNWATVHPFHYHRKDWYVPEICDGDIPVQHAPIVFCNLRLNQNLTAPTPIQLSVDHRTPVAYYFQNMSYIVMLEDGGLAISDGFGFELKSVGGNVDISTPGDLNLRAGKSVTMWAGWDAVIKANNSADITANIGDVRIKAEHNLQMLSGNDGQGGTLIENRATCAGYDFTESGQAAKHSGIMLVSGTAPITAFSSDIMLQTQENEDRPGSGNIVLYTDKDVKTYATNLFSYMSSRVDFFEGTDVSNEYWPQHTLLGGALRVKGPTYITGSLVTGDWITVLNGHIATSQVATYNGLVAGIADASLEVIEEQLQVTEDRIDYLELLKADNDLPAYENEVLTDTAGSAFFTLRRVADYKTTGYKFFESRWQQQARITSNIPAYWTENPVVTDSDDSYPYPGKQVILGNSWCLQDLTLFSLQTGSAIDREDNQDDYESPEFGVTTVVALDGNYPIISNC